MKTLLGTKKERKVYGIYEHNSSSLPCLKISGKFYHGSSLGPANFRCDPNKADIEYWQNIAWKDGLIDKVLTIKS